jgi:hypothetical protein
MGPSKVSKGDCLRRAQHYLHSEPYHYQWIVEGKGDPKKKPSMANKASFQVHMGTKNLFD